MKDFGSKATQSLMKSRFCLMCLQLLKIYYATGAIYKLFIWSKTCFASMLLLFCWGFKNMFFKPFSLPLPREVQCANFWMRILTIILPE